ncbi:MAG: RIP metalloprotease RseP [Candidatus Moranbacteria bacterium]|nr:RIP metalloprotease RseP [Candidatus Moranbacteria bacterium]OIQ01678.1 MAG: RIP metalloprotease RseP [Candidatus Moranbacteria bacterium CG2_30_41_165]PIP25916.1 MAG: RIP metalloprotease RseP [Candidatus Moranbacteria bacterium CG23_combo_of_CG06-09_8_20_14_all_41_28]PIV86556.1 MAG: RIP metalloprotease RseP [Candidatus Moranbacteria bacterium CG17_big_fil_post_rev_8_21_14_2_50_41_107]PIW94276.1 MAG: RIP metalloprotease RseP [Candidatus Moranbacteria bacterium CG_4_8_14_3_um_filter_41_13]PI
MLTVLIFLALLASLVLFHELGHFIVARRNGIKADEFGFGFPPRMFGVYKDDTTGRHKIVWGNKDIESPHTVYSFNWLPLGGFVKIKGEDGQNQEADSFGNKSAWIRVKVLGAGVFMNFVLAWVLISVVFILGLPQPIDSTERAQYPDAKIQILEVKKGTPAETMGLQLGDEVLMIAGEKMRTLDVVKETILKNKGQNIDITINRLGKEMVLSGTPRTEYPANEGSLGISFSETAIVSYPWYQAFYQGAITTYNITIAILQAFGTMIAGLFGEKTGAPVDVTGPVGIVYMTKQMSDLGISYLLQFAALLSINLGIINVLPIPALDGGRILFVLIEKLKGSKVSHRTEGMIHQIGFILLLLLMLFITIRDFAHFRILEKIGSFFM